MRFKAELLDTSWRTSVSYITGAHALKVGYQDHVGWTLGNFNMPSPTTCRTPFPTARPSADRSRAPLYSETHVHDGGIYAQDRWTIKRLTLNLGVRCDFYRTNYPAADARTDAVHPEPQRDVSGRRPRELQRHHAEARRRVRPVRQRRTAVKASLASTSSQLTYTGPTATPPTRRSRPCSP